MYTSQEKVAWTVGVGATLLYRGQPDDFGRLVLSKSAGQVLRPRGADLVVCAHSDEWPQNPDPSRVSKRPR